MQHSFRKPCVLISFPPGLIVWFGKEFLHSDDNWTFLITELRSKGRQSSVVLKKKLGLHYESLYLKNYGHYRNDTTQIQPSDIWQRGYKSYKYLLIIGTAKLDT